MSRANRLFSDDRGSAIVEMALVLPLFILLLFWAVYFTEFSVLRIRQQEAARFLVWESTAHALSDFDTGRHAPKMEEMRRAALERTRARYQNLEGHNTSSRATTWLARPQLGALEVRPVAFADRPTDAQGHELLGEVERSVRGGGGLPIFSSLVRGIEGGLGPSLRAMGFPLEVGAEARVEVAIENLLVGEGAPFPEKLRRLSLEVATGQVEGETWALGRGDDVGLADADHPFARQVGRMAYLGMDDRFRGISRDLGVLSELLPFPPKVRVVSQRYVAPGTDGSELGCEGEALAATGKWRNGPRVQTPADRISPAKCFDTLPMEANGLGAGYEGDPTYRQLRARGEGHLGCPLGGCDAFR